MIVAPQQQLDRVCQWCGAPAVARILIQPAQSKVVTKVNPITGEQVRAPEIVQFAIEADVCAEHLTVRDREGGTPLRDPRRRKAKDVEQLDLFDGPAQKPANAIKGAQ